MSRTAVVLGAGVAGCLAVRVLSGHFDQVRWLEKDDELDRDFRPGAPQSRHLHVLLRRGREALEDLFPGLDESLARDGAPEVDWAEDVAWQGRFGWYPRYVSGVKTRSASRTLLERRLRERALDLPNVELEAGCQVKGLSWEKGRITAAVTDLGLRTGDFFVDTTGRAGLSSTVVRKVASGIGYASCLLRIPPAAFPGFKQVYVQMRPPVINRGAVLMQVENGLTLFTVIGSGADRPGADPNAYLALIDSLPDPIIGQLYRAAEWRSEISVYRRTEGILRRPPIPAPNGVALGDSTCAFNPVYGQGMTVAALQALQLEKLLSHGGRIEPRKLETVLRLPWFMATSEDLRVPEARFQGVSRSQRLLMRGFSRVSDRILRRATRDPELHRAFLRVLHLMDGPLDLFSTYARRSW